MRTSHPLELVLPDVLTSGCPYVSSSSSNTNGFNRRGGDDEGQVIGGGSCDDEQGLTSGDSRP